MSTRIPVGSGTRNLEKREFLDFTENFQAYVYYYAYLTLLLCVFELTVARNNYIYVSISLYLSAGLCLFVYHTPPVSLAWWGSWHNALWGCCYITDTTRHPWLGE